LFPWINAAKPGSFEWFLAKDGLSPVGIKTQWSLEAIAS